ncbi:hypothetical protein DFH09DRAFT_1093536 [Mycena vulgaris]|nr:hypothetical protein DFH09DRAFT_1093536 [Mycena vulgaris]
MYRNQKSKDDHRERAGALRHRQRATAATAGLPVVHRCRAPARSMTTMSHRAPMLTMTPARSQGSKMNLDLCVSAPPSASAFAASASQSSGSKAPASASALLIESESGSSVDGELQSAIPSQNAERGPLTNAAGVDRLTHPPTHPPDHSRRPPHPRAHSGAQRRDTIPTRHGHTNITSACHTSHLVDAKHHGIGFGTPSADGMCAVYVCGTAGGALSHHIASRFAVVLVWVIGDGGSRRKSGNVEPVALSIRWKCNVCKVIKLIGSEGGDTNVLTVLRYFERDLTTPDADPRIAYLRMIGVMWLNVLVEAALRVWKNQTRRETPRKLGKRMAAPDSSLQGDSGWGRWPHKRAPLRARGEQVSPARAAGIFPSGAAGILRNKVV